MNAMPAENFDSKAESVRASFLEQFESLAPTLLAWAGVQIRPSLKPWLDPEDLLQEIALRAWAGFHGYAAHRASFRTWIYAIAHNTLCEHLRRIGRSPKRTARRKEGESRLSFIEDRVTSVGTRVSRLESVRRLVLESHSLEEADRSLLLLRGLEGLDFAATAVHLGVTDDVARQRWRRLRLRLIASNAAADLLQT